MSAASKTFLNKKRFILILLSAFVLFAVVGQELLPVSGIPHLFYGQFDNGLDFYFVEDYSAPTSSFCYAVKAGTSVQTAETTGFSEMYARLFFSPVGGQQVFYDKGAFSVSAECTSDYALYSATFSADRITDILSLLAECAGAESFPEDELWTQYEAMRRKASEWDASSESYINGAMDAKMFPAYPWSRETGLYADSFNGYWVDQTASILDEMRRTYYVPENAALFMCGPFAPDEVFGFLVSLAPVADNARTVGSAPSIFELATIAPSVNIGNGGRYVLVSDGFSKEFNQISVQYVLPESFMTAAEAAAAETAALVLENGSAFKSLVLKDETCGIKSADWLYTSLSRQQSGSRFIVQALMENGEVSPGTQALAFARCIENPDVFPADEVAYFSRITADRLSLLRRDPFTLIHTLAEDWAFCMPVFPELNRALSEQGLPAISFNKSFAEQFTASYAAAARSLSAAELSHVLDSEPYIFLLLNNDVYKANKNALEKEGFTLIQQDKGEWYKTGEYKLGDYKLGGNPATPFESENKSFTGLAAEKLALVIVAELQLSDATASRASSVQTEIAYSGEQAQSVAQDANLAQNFDGIDNYIAHGKTATKLETLSNGIPVLVQNGTSSAFSFKIQFSGKKEGFSASERDMRTVISDVIANNIRQYLLRSGAVPYSGFSVSPECMLYGSSVVVSTTTEYAEPVISLAAEALFFGEISAPRIDESAYSRSSELSLKRADGDFQLHSAALARLYQGTVGADYFDLKGDFLANITFQDIEMEYLSMLDASCISLSVYGENASNYLSLAEDCFGFLRSFSSSCRDSAVSAPSTAFPDETVPVTLRRIFTSSVKPGEYVAQPPKLIPTEVFYDPFHIYFECPAYDSPEYAVFVALVYELADVLDEMWEPGVLPSIDMLYAPIASVWFHGVTRAADVYDVFTKGIEKLQEPFDEARIKKICDRYVEKFCSQEDSATSCTDKMLVSRFYSSKVTNGGITVYLSQFEQLKNATSKDFAKIAARFKTLPLLRSVSADTK